MYPGRGYGTPEGGPRSGGSGGPPPGNFVNLDCKSLILGTSRGHRKYKQTELLYEFFGFLVLLKNFTKIISICQIILKSSQETKTKQQLSEVEKPTFMQNSYNSMH